MLTATMPTATTPTATTPTATTPTATTPTATTSMRLVFLLLLGLFGAGLWAPTATAQQFVYQPTIPAFGGSPLNYQWLSSSAQTQNAFKPGRSTFRRDPLANFERTLQRQILSQLSRELVANRFGGDFDPTQEGLFDLGEFTVEIIPGLGGASIRIFNELTGEETTVTIPNF